MQQIIAQLLFGGDPELSGRGDVALARPAGAAQGGQAPAGGGADTPALPEDAPAGRRAPVLAPRPNTSTSAVTAATSCGACTTTTSMPISRGTKRSTTRPAGSVRPSSPRRPTSGRTGATGWSATVIRSGRSGRTCAPGGTFAILPNVKLVHFANLKRDMPGQMRTIADVPRHPDQREADWDVDPRATAPSTG